MAERNVSVKLSANVAPYMAAMAKAKAATSGLASSGADLTRLGGTMQSVGRTMSIGVTAPLLALGAGAVSMAAKFDTAFAQMVGLANVPAAEVDALKESVLALAGETAVAPQELAEGLYFAASAGLDAAAAMDVVEMAARASAAGMGSTADVVNLVTGAIAAYGADNITAAAATDILTAAIREGKAEPTEMADALGRVTPIAAQMGIGFDEVAGAVAYMSKTLGDTDETVTALRGALLAMMDPTAQGKKALETMGTSAGELQAAIASDGLLGALDLLRSHGFNENSVAMSDLFEDNRALVGATILLNDATGDLVPVMDAVTNSAGSAGEAFSAVADTDAFKMKQALTDIKVAMIQVGEVLLPIVADIASSISGLTGWFSELDPAVQKVVVAVAGLAAAAGPAVFVAGSLVKNWQAVSGVFKNAEGATSKLGRAAGALGLFGIAAGVAYLAFKFFTRSEELATTHIDTASAALQTETVAAYNAAVAAGQATTEVDALAIAHLALSNAISEAADDELNKALATLNITSEETLDVLTALGSGSLPTIQAQMQSLTEEFFGIDAAQAKVALSLRGTGASYEEIASTIGTTVEVVEAWDDAMGTTTGFADHNKQEINDLALEYLNLQARIPGVTSATLLAAEAIAGNRNEAMNAVPVYEKYVEMVLALPPAQRDAAMATDGFVGSLDELIPSAGGAAGALGELTDVAASSIDTLSQYQSWADDLSHILGEYTSQIDAAVEPHRNLTNSIEGVWAAATEFGDAINDNEGDLDLLTQGIDETTEAGRENRDLIQGWADDVIDLAKARLQDGESIDSVNNDYRFNRDAILDAAEAAGFNRDAVDEMLTKYGMVPELVTTSIELANDALAKWRIDRYLEKLDGIPEEQATAIEAAIDDRDWAEANRLLNLLETPRDVPIRPYLTQSSFHVSVTGGHGGTGMVGILTSAGGRYVDRPMLSTLGERGHEVVLPLDDPARMAALLGMSEVGPRVAAAFGKLTPGAPYGYQNAPSTATQRADLPPIYVYNNGRDITPHDIARAIVESRAA